MSIDPRTFPAAARTMRPRHTRGNGRLRRVAGGGCALVLIVGLIATPGPALAVSHDGRLDSRFGSGGVVLTDFAGSYDTVYALAAQRDGRVIAAGAAGDPALVGSTEFGMARYHRSGALDRSFGVGGRVITDFLLGGSQINAVVVQADGKLVAAGVAFPGGESPPDFALARYNVDGSLDATFGVGGKVTTDFGLHDVATALVVQPDGKLVAAGLSTVPTVANIVLSRYHRDGSLDTSFGAGGKVTTTLADLAYANALVLQPDGRLVAAGSTITATNSDFALVRYHRDGSLDTSFGVGGIVTTDFAGNRDEAAALVIHDGKLVAGGMAGQETSADFGLARYHHDGSLDTRFGVGGKVITDFGGLEELKGLAIQADKVIAAGTATSDSGFLFALARYHHNGTLDTHFGVEGKVTTDLVGSTDQIKAVTWQANRLVAAGWTSFGASSDFALARYRM